MGNTTVPVKNPPTPLDGGETRNEQVGSIPARTVIAERYRIVKFIAKGGMGEVYEATDQALGIGVAIKTIRPDLVSSDGARARFRREITTAREVTHRNVCRVFDLHVHEGPPLLTFLTMELLTGESLAKRLAAGGVDRATARSVLADVVAGLAAAHAEGVVHRDIKPANIMLLDEGRAVITDFGIALTVASGINAWVPPNDPTPHTSTSIAGTPPYMAPELTRGTPPSCATDIYALGVMMHELQHGALPGSHTVPYWRDGRWEATTRACLAADPKDRPPSVQAVLAAAVGSARSRGRWLAAGALMLAVVTAAVVITALSRGDETAVAESAIRTPPNVATAVEVARSHMRELNPHAARLLLREVVERTTSPVVFAELAGAELAAGDPARARHAVARADLLVAGAPSQVTTAERLLVEARRREVAGAWPDAVQSWAALTRLDANSVDHALELSRAHVGANDLEQAKRVIDALRARGVTGPHVDLVEALIADRANQLPRELELGIAVARRPGASPALVAQGELAAGTAAAYLGDLPKARASLDTAARLFRSHDNPGGLSEAVRMQSMIAVFEGDLRRARALAETARVVGEKAGDLRAQANALGALAVVDNRLANYDSSLDAAQRAHAAYMALGDQRQVAWALQQAGNTLYMRDDIAGARAKWLEALGTALRTGDRAQAGELAFNLADASLTLGDLGAVRRYADEASAHFRDAGDRRSMVHLTHLEARLALERADFDAALSHAAKARAEWTAIGDTAAIAKAAVVEAEVALARSQAVEASRIVQEALESKEIDPATEAALTAVAVRAALARGDAATARRLFGRARLASPAATASRSRAFDALETMLAHAEGRRAEALAMARELRRAAASDPFPIYAQVEILAASIEKKVGDRRDGIARLAALATDAADHGMILVARQARAQ